MRSWPWFIAGSLLLAGCASVDPVVVAMHGGDPTDAGETESPYVPPPDVLAEGLMPRPPQPEPTQLDEHGGHAPAPDGVELPAADAFSCPMHPDVLSPEAGTCPQCGMALEPVDTVYACPMHPEVMSRTAGECHKCGMSLRRPGESP